jgi:hypothetical protein
MGHIPISCDPRVTDRLGDPGWSASVGSVRQQRASAGARYDQSLEAVVPCRDAADLRGRKYERVTLSHDMGFAIKLNVSRPAYDGPHLLDVKGVLGALLSGSHDDAP